MTQKELLYIEDAIEHESTIIKVCEDTLNRLQDENLISFMNSEIQIHQNTKETILNKLKEKSNE